MKNLIALLLMVFLMTPLAAQDQDKPERDKKLASDRERPDRRQGERGPRETRGRRPGMDHRSKVLEKFKREKPAEYERLTKLQAEDPEKFREELSRIMRKKMANRSEGFLNRIKEEDPEKYERLMELKEEDPGKFRDEVMKEFGNKMRGEHDVREKQEKDHHESFADIRKLSEQYKNASEDQKATIKEEIRTKVEELVSKELKFQVERADKLEKYLDSIKTQIKERQSNKDKMVDEKVERILNSDFHRGGGKSKTHKKGSRSEQ
jgi:hypothetical protein